MKTDGSRQLDSAAFVSIVAPWNGVAEPIHRRIAHFVDAAPGQEMLWIGCGTGRSVLWWAERFRTRAQGIDPDGRAIERAEAAARGAGLQGLVTFQQADPADLPHEERVFDLTVVNVLQLSGADQSAAVRQASRVVRPMGTVAGIVTTWLRTPGERDRRLVGLLGVRPRLLVEWKAIFREAGIVELAVQDAARESGWIASAWPGILLRAWRTAGWRGISAVLRLPFRTFRRLVLERTIGLSTVKGIRWPHA